MNSPRRFFSILTHVCISGHGVKFSGSGGTMKRLALTLLAIPFLLPCSGISNAQMSSSKTGISGAKNPEKIPLHVAAFSWFHLAAIDMNDGPRPYRFAQDISNTRLSETDQAVLKAVVSNFDLNYAPLLAAYKAKVASGPTTADDVQAFNKAKYLLALGALAQTKQQMSAGGAAQFAAYIESWKGRVVIDEHTGSELP